MLANLLHATRYNAHLKKLIQAQYKSGDKVLDFGAGNGNFLNLIADKPGEFSAVEPDSKLREHIRNSAAAHVVDPDELPLGAFDFLYTINVLEHIQDDRDAMSKFSLWLRPGGTLLIYVPAIPHLYSKFDASIGHFRRYRKSELVEGVTEAGFQITMTRYLDPVGYLVALIYRIFINTGKVSHKQVVFFDRYLFPLSVKLQSLTSKLFGKNLLLIATKT